MQAGFALVKAGLTRSKNVSNIMMKNLMDMSAGVLAFALVGFGIAGVEQTTGDGLLPSTFFFFQAAFAATAGHRRANRRVLGSAV